MSKCIKCGRLHLLKTDVCETCQADAVYEIIDATNDEMYFPVNMFYTLEEARNYILNYDREHMISDYAEDHEVITIVRRPINQHHQGTRLESYQRAHLPNEEDDEYYWVTEKLEEVQ